jgi:1-aminocyclopropane-1-carboxylate deaminase/D-cysteine desulfhydrase-like pyridoxal-dependent ACC family enzyme
VPFAEPLLHSRRNLAHGPTPLDHAPRFSASVGRQVWIKRDDIGSAGYAGNKIRKLEYIAAEADADGVDTFVIVGALQSNAARAVAALAAATGRRCIIVVPGARPAARTPEGNHLLSLLFGAELRFSGNSDWAATEEHAAAMLAELRGGGRTVMVLPPGCSSPIGVIGFVAAYRELLDQIRSLEAPPAAIVHASGSGGTAAGLHLGRSLYGGPPIVSVDVGRLFVDIRQRIAALATEAATALGAPRAVDEADVNLTFGFVGDGYSVPTAEGLDAIRLLARTEGVVCDPVYSGKALAAVASARAHIPEGPVVFWHTGGAQSVLTCEASGQLLPDCV